MLDGISDIAQGIRLDGQQESAVTFGTMAEELKAKCSPARITELLSKESFEETDRRRNVNQAARLLRKAAIAASSGNPTRCFRMVRLALEVLGRDKQAIRSLLVAHNLSFSIIRPQSKAAGQALGPLALAPARARNPAGR